MNSTIRTFIAVPVPDSIRSQIADFQSTLRQQKADIKWVRSESIHITLKFLGDVQEDKIEEISRILQVCIEDVDSFILSITGTGAFPNLQRPRVLWIGIEQGLRQLGDLSKRINRALEDIGFESEKRPFSGHVTLGRVRSPNRLGLTIEKMMKLGFESNPFKIENVLFMKSDLKPTGAEYTVLAKIQLKG